MNKRKIQAVIWVFVWIILTILPFFTLGCCGFSIIIIPFAFVLLIKLLIELINGDYD